MSFGLEVRFVGGLVFEGEAAGSAVPRESLSAAFDVFQMPRVLLVSSEGGRIPTVDLAGFTKVLFVPASLLLTDLGLGSLFDAVACLAVEVLGTWVGS